MATPVESETNYLNHFKQLHVMFLAIIMWVLTYIADTPSQDKTKETLNLAVALDDLNDDTVSDDEILEEMPVRRKQRPTTSDELNANVSQARGSELEKISKEMAQMDLSFQERVVTKDSSCDFSSRIDDDEDSSPEDTEEYSLGGQINTICEEDEDVTVLKVDRHVEHRVYEIQNSKPKRYKAEEFARRFADGEYEEVESSATDQSPAKVLIECANCKRSFGLDIISQHIQFCKVGKAQGNNAEELKK